MRIFTVIGQSLFCLQIDIISFTRYYCAMSFLKSRLFLAFLFVVFFFVGPAAFILKYVPVRVTVFLWIGVLIAVTHLYLTKSFDHKEFLELRFCLKDFKRIFIRFLTLALLATIILFLVKPENFLIFPRQRPGIWILVMFLYPLFSVLPQTFIYRFYFMHLYGPLFSSKTSKLLLGAISFSFIHVMMHNWIAITFTLVGGFIIIETYDRTRSFWLTWLEHTLYGCFVFSIGFGEFLYSRAAGY